MLARGRHLSGRNTFSVARKKKKRRKKKASGRIGECAEQFTSTEDRYVSVARAFVPHSSERSKNRLKKPPLRNDRKLEKKLFMLRWGCEWCGRRCGNEHNARVHAEAMHMHDRNRITSCDLCEMVYDLAKHRDHVASRDHYIFSRVLTGEFYGSPRMFFFLFFFFFQPYFCISKDAN